MLIEEKHSTQKLTLVLCEARLIQHYFDCYEDELITELPYQYLKRKIKEKGIKKKDIYKRSGLDSYVYRVLSGERNPSRDKLLRITISMELNHRHACSTYSFRLKIFQNSRHRDYMIGRCNNKVEITR